MAGKFLGRIGIYSGLTVEQLRVPELKDPEWAT